MDPAAYDKNIFPIIHIKFDHMISQKILLRNQKSTENTWRARRPQIVHVKDVVVKMANYTKDPERLERLKKERNFYKDAAKNDELKQFIPHYYGCVNHEDNLYLIIEFLASSIKKYPNEGTRGRYNAGFIKFLNLTYDKKLNLFIQIAIAIKELHSQGVALTNIHPNNVLLREEEDTITPVLINFGRLQRFDPKLLGKETDISKELLLRDKSEMAKYIFERQKDAPIELEQINLPKFDVIKFAHLIYSTTVHRNGKKRDPDYTKRFEREMGFINRMNCEDSWVYFNQPANIQTNTRSILTAMTMPFEELTITFQEIISRIKEVMRQVKPEEIIMEEKEIEEENKESNPLKRQAPSQNESKGRKRTKLELVQISTLDNHAPDVSTETRLLHSNKHKVSKMVLNNDKDQEKNSGGERCFELKFKNFIDEPRVINDVDDHRINPYGEFHDSDDDSEVVPFI
jgi:serine/threonine protein kinase